MLICGGIYREGCFRKRHPSFFELEMREKSETNLKITIYFFLFGKVDKLMFSAQTILAFCRGGKVLQTLRAKRVSRLPSITAMLSGGETPPLQGLCVSANTPLNINLTHYTKKQGGESLMTQPLIFIDAPLIDFGYIDMYNTDITF